MVNERRGKQMNLFDQLQALQIIPDAFENWAAYREELTRYIIEQAYGKQEIAVLGCGRCNDIDIKLLSMYFEKVYLIDKDQIGMEAALKQYGLWEHPRIEMRTNQFTGIEDDDLRDYADLLVREVRRRGMLTDVDELAGVALEALDNLEEKLREYKSTFGQYENTVTIGVHSQLINMLHWIWQVILETIGKEEERVRQRIMLLNELCTSQFNEAIVKATKMHMIVGCEESKVGKIGTIQGAFQGMADIEKRIQVNQLSRVNEEVMLWPFNKKEEKVYQMRIQTLKIR